MPLYEYECETCGAVFEKMQKFSDAPLTEHENCGGHVHKRMTAPSFQFKGTGWYITDYGRGGKTKDANGNAKPATDSKGEPAAPSTTESSKSDSSSSTSNSAPKSESAKPAAAAPSKSSEK